MSEATRYNPRGQLLIGSEVGETSVGPQGVLQVSTKTSTLPNAQGFSLLVNRMYFQLIYSK